MLPIRRLLLREQTVTFVAVVLALVSLTWLGLSRTLDSQVQARSEESLVRLSRDLRVYLEEGERVGDTVGRYWRDGQIHTGDPARINRLVRPLVEAFPSIANLAITEPSGRGILFQRKPTGVTAIVAIPRDRDQLVFHGMAQGWITAFPEGELSMAVIRQRPWFIAAQQSQVPTWVDGYTFIIPPDRGISYVMPLRNSKGELECIVSVDIRLDTLSRRVWETRPTPGSLAMICNEERKTLLVPMDASALKPSDPSTFLKPIGPDFLPLFHDLLTTWQKHKSNELVRMQSEGRGYSGRVVPLTGLQGLHWLLCIAVPNQDYLGTTYKLVAILSLIGSLFLLLTLWRIHRLSRRIGDPLDELAKAAKALGEGHLPNPPATDLKEIQTLGEALHIAGVAIQNEAEMQLKLEHSQRLETVGTLAGGIAHDVNNQLASILGQISLAGDMLPDQHPAMRRLNRAEEAVERCAQMVKSLLGFSHRVRPELRPLDLNELVVHTSTLLERLLGGLIRIELFLSPCLPSILGEPVQLEQVLLNLAVNARDAMPEGGKLTIRTFPSGSQVCLSVEDTGKGIPKEVLPRIFEPFFTTKELGKGTGLGLAMVFSIVKAHGGRIDADSQEGAGTRMRIFFEPQTETLTKTQTIRNERKAYSFEGVRILVAEDEPNLRELLSDGFSQRGALIVASPDGAAAWTQFQRHPFDLVISDHRMPECTGLELLGRIRASGSQIPMILASGFGLEGLEEELAKDPHLRFRPKPCMMQDFFALASELLNQSPAAEAQPPQGPAT